MPERLAIDCDDVIANTTGAVVSHARSVLARDIPVGNISCERYWRNRMSMTKGIALGFMKTFEMDGYPGIQPVEGVRVALEELSRSFELHVVTARMKYLRGVTEDFLRSHGLDSVIVEIHYSKNPFYPNGAPTKADICRDIGARALIDDSPREIAGMVSNEQAGILFGDNPWQVMPRGIDATAQLHAWDQYQTIEDLAA